MAALSVITLAIRHQGRDLRICVHRRPRSRACNSAGGALDERVGMPSSVSASLYGD